MPDWTASMKQTFEYYTVDPGTWKDIKKLDNVKSCTITRDSTVETLGSATIDTTESFGECYIRVYLITIQKGVTEKHPLGTFLVQTPSSKFDGKVTNTTMDAYTPLLELKENPPDLGYSILKGENIMDNAYRLVREHARAPVVKTECTEVLYNDFVANTNDTWTTFITDLIKNANYELALDELGRILFSPKQDTASLQPVCTFDDGNSSILYPEFTVNRDIYGIPNIIEVTYTTDTETYYAKAVNDDSNSPTSTVNRGRPIRQVITNPDLVGEPSQHQVEEYAEQLLKELSTLEYTVSFTHGYYPVRIRDCVRLNHDRAELRGVKAKIVSQSIKCEPGCPVTAKAVFTARLWR